MKLVCLNVWGGKVYEPLMQFLKERANDTDIFCFQEVFRAEKTLVSAYGHHTNIFSDVTKILPDFNGHFAGMQKGIVDFNPLTFANFGIDIGNAIFVKKSIKIKSSGNEIVHKGKKKVVDPRIDISRSLQYVQVDAGKPITIFNFHGIATWPKTDTAERLKQAKMVHAAMDKFKGEKILCGDFNLAPDTETMKIMESPNMRNLIKEFGVISTRSKLFDRGFEFSDYLLVSPRIKVKKFDVSNVAISDHLPLILEFE